MTRWATLAIGFLAFCSFPVTGPAQAQSGEGWITLFDGKNLDHWQGDGNANFAIDDGSIVAKDKKDAKTTAFLISKEKYKDFQILRGPQEARSQDLLRVQHLRHAARPELWHRRHRLSRRGRPDAQGRWQVEHHGDYGQGPRPFHHVRRQENRERPQRRAHRRTIGAAIR